MNDHKQKYPYILIVNPYNPEAISLIYGVTKKTLKLYIQHVSSGTGDEYLLVKMVDIKEIE